MFDTRSKVYDIVETKKLYNFGYAIVSLDLERSKVNDDGTLTFILKYQDDYQPNINYILEKYGIEYTDADKLNEPKELADVPEIVKEEIIQEVKPEIKAPVESEKIKKRELDIREKEAENRKSIIELKKSQLELFEKSNPTAKERIEFLRELNKL